MAIWSSSGFVVLFVAIALLWMLFPLSIFISFVQNSKFNVVGYDNDRPTIDTKISSYRSIRRIISDNNEIVMIVLS